MSIVKNILRLPPFIEFEGVQFDFELFIENHDEIRLVYKITGCKKSSPHHDDIEYNGCWENPFEDGRPKGFLYLHEGIDTDENLEEALCDCFNWLTKNDLI